MLAICDNPQERGVSDKMLRTNDSDMWPWREQTPKTSAAGLQLRALHGWKASQVQQRTT